MIFSSDSAIQNPEVVEYSLFEIVFWYSALFIVVILFVIMITHRKTNHKKMEIMANKLGKEIKKYDLLLNEEFDYKKSKDAFSKTLLILNGFGSSLIEMKEKTMMSEFDALLEKKNEISNFIKKLDSKKKSFTTKEIELLKAQLIEYKEEIDLDKNYLK